LPARCRFGLVQVRSGIAGIAGIDILRHEDDIDRRDRWSASRRAAIEDAIQGPATTRVFDCCGVGRSLQTEVPIIGTAAILTAANG
jgi:hypothetical protein